jgi:Double zinc ribbon
MKCPGCQHENREGRRFCAECGASLALACLSCGFSNEPGEKFCGGCGAPLGASAGAAPDARFNSPESYTPKHLAVASAPAAFRGSCGVPRPSMAPYVTGTGATRGRALPEGC